MKCIAAVAAARMDVLVCWMDGCAGALAPDLELHLKLLAAVVISPVRGNAIQGNAIQGNAIQGNAIQGNVMQGNAMQGNAMQGMQFKTLQGKRGAWINCMQAPTANRVVNNIELRGEWALRIQ